jgi:thioredoxin reductase
MLNIAIVGAGPYGLSIAAHLRRRGIPFRIFGRPMDSWLRHMPKGMLLKSDGFASNIYDPGAEFTLARFCAERGIEYSDTGTPVQLETFASYGLAFRDRMVPELEDKLVTEIDRVAGGFRISLDDGETTVARQVVLAIGISHFDYVPDSLAGLPTEFLTHSSRHHDLEPFRGRKVVVIGGGSSAIDLAGLLKDVDADVELVSRHPLKFHSTPTGKPRSWWQQLRHPKSGLGPGLRSRFYSDAPMVFHWLPQNVRLRIVQTALGPSGGWFSKDKVVGRVRTVAGFAPQRAELQGDKVKLNLRSGDGTERQIVADHIIAATGYRVNMNRLSFLSEQIRSQVRAVEGSPILSSAFESSVPGLYFAGVSAAASFGPVMRFAFGAGFAANVLTEVLTRVHSRQTSSSAVTRAVTTTD